VVRGGKDEALSRAQIWVSAQFPLHKRMRMHLVASVSVTVCLGRVRVCAHGSTSVSVCVVVSPHYWCV
jgi:hypothetical protein